MRLPLNTLTGLALLCALGMSVPAALGTESFEQAKHMIDRIAAGGWRGVPKGVTPSTYTPPAEPAFPDSIFGW